MPFFDGCVAATRGTMIISFKFLSPYGSRGYVSTRDKIRYLETLSRHIASRYGQFLILA